MAIDAISAVSTPSAAAQINAAQNAAPVKVSETSYTMVDGSVITTITYSDGTTESTTQPGDTVSFSFSPSAATA